MHHCYYLVALTTHPRHCDVIGHTQSTQPHCLTVTLTIHPPDLRGQAHSVHSFHYLLTKILKNKWFICNDCISIATISSDDVFSDDNSNSVRKEFIWTELSEAVSMWLKNGPFHDFLFRLFLDFNKREVYRIHLHLRYSMNRVFWLDVHIGNFWQIKPLQFWYQIEQNFIAESWWIIFFMKLIFQNG